jgi:hypothetical protein
MEQGTARFGDYEYDVCLTFAGENRDYVEEVARDLQGRGIRVFFDGFERAELWGKDLYEHLAYIYSRAARYCVLFASEAYAAKAWPTHERRNAQERAFGDHGEYVLPARFDDTEIPGLPETVRYEDLRQVSPSELAALIDEKLGPRQKENFLPPSPDRVFELLDVDEESEDVVAHKVRQFFQSLQRMSGAERKVVYAMMIHGCHAEMPDNVHISADLLRRITGIPPAELKSVLAGVRPLGFQCRTHDDESTKAEHELLPDDEMLALSWSDLSTAPKLPNIGDLVVGEAMIRAAREPYCEVHAEEALERLNFTGLSAATFEPEEH